MNAPTESEPRQATPEDVERSWTTRDLAEYFGVPIQTVAKAANRGSIPGCSKILGRYVFDRVESLKWQPAAVTATPTDLAKGPQGKFQKGNAFGVGNRGGRPKREVELRFLSTLVGTVSPDDWKEIILVAVAQAKKGEWRARAWLGNYLVGTPVQRVQVEADITARQEFSVGEQAAAIMTLLRNAEARITAQRERDAARIVDAELSDAAS